MMAGQDIPGAAASPGAAAPPEGTADPRGTESPAPTDGAASYDVLARQTAVRTPHGASTPSIPLPDDLGFTPWEHWAWGEIAATGSVDMRSYPAGAKIEAAIEAAQEAADERSAQAGKPAQAGIAEPGETATAGEDLAGSQRREARSGATDPPEVDAGETQSGATASGASDSGSPGEPESGEPESGAGAPVRDDLPVWPAHRSLSEKFLRLVLLSEPWASARARERVAIYFARFEEAIDFGGASARGDMVIAHCRFEDDVTLIRFRLAGSLLLLDCRFCGPVIAPALSTEGDIFLHASTFDKTAQFRSAQCPGQFAAHGATFEAGLDANSATARGGVFLSSARFGGELDLAASETASIIVLTDSHLEDGVDLTGARNTGLVLDGARIEGDAECRAMEVNGQFSAQNTIFEGALRLAWLQCSGGLFLRAGAGQGGNFVPRASGAVTRIGGELGLTGARISGGAFDMRGIDCTGFVDAEGMVVDGAARLDHSAFTGPVRFSGARFARNLSASGATFAAAVKLSNVLVENNLLLRARPASLDWQQDREGDDGGARAAVGPVFRGELDLAGARVGGALDLSGATFEGPVDLTAADIAGELRLASSSLAPPDWGAGARLILRNLKARAIQATQEALLRNRERPAQRARRSDYVETDLTGAIFERLSGADAARGASLAEAPARVLAKWIEAHADYQLRHDPGPYRETADALRKAGRPGAARIVLIENYDHEISCRQTKLGRRLVLAVWNIFTRYGFSVTLPLLVWVPLLIAAQMTAGLWAEGWRPGGGQLPGLADLGSWFIAAASNTVPIVDLAPSGSAELDHHFPDGPPHWLEQTWFWGAVFGFIVLSYLAAAIGGLARTDRD